MRVLHAVGLHEQLVASGVYLSDQGEATGQEEHWSIYALPDGARMIRVDRDRRKVDGTSTLIEGWQAPMDEGGQLERVRLSAFGKGIGQINAHYSVVDGFVEVWRQSADGRETFELPVTAATILLPVSDLFMGLALAQGDLATVCYVPQGEAILKPQEVTYAVVAQDVETVQVGRQDVEARVFNVTDGQSSRRFWIDAYGITQQTADDAAGITTRLTRYVRRS